MIDRSGIEARLAAATPGPWASGVDLNQAELGAQVGYWVVEDIIAVDQLPVPTLQPGADFEEDCERISEWEDAHSRGTVAATHNYLTIPDEQHDANNRLIGHAPTDLRDLLDENERLQAELDFVLARLEAERRHVRPRCYGRSSDALAMVGLGRTDQPTSAPNDRGDLDACELTYRMAPPWVQERMLPHLERFRQLVGERYPDDSDG